MQRRVMSSESEFEKQKALLEQKITFLEQTLKQSQEKEKSLQSEIMKQKEEFMTNIKVGSNKFDGTIKQINDQMEELRESLLEKDSELNKTKQLKEQAENSKRELQKILDQKSDLSNDEFKSLNSECEKL